MSDYYDQPRRQKSTRGAKTRDSYADDSGYGRDAPRGDAGSLVRRRDSTSSVDEEITREFPPGDGGRGYYKETTIRKSGTRPVRARSYGADSRYDDKSSYASSRRYNDSSKRSSRGYDDRRDDRRSGGRSRRDQSYSSDESRSRSRDKGRRKSGIEETLGALGLGGVIAAVTGKKDRSRSKSRDRGGRGRARSYSSERSRKGGRSQSRGKQQISQAVKAALLAGAGEAFRARKEPGGWGGDKGKRVLTAAIAAGGVDGILTQKKDPDKHSTRDVIGSAFAGLAANRLINGARSKSRGPAGSPDGRGRSQSRGGLGDLLAGGALAGVAKKGYDNWRERSKSRGRERSRSSSGSSYDSRTPPRNRSQNRRRSQSVSGYAAKGLAAIGLKDVADKVDPERRSSKRGNSYNDGGYGNQDRDVGSRSRSIGPDGNGEVVSKRPGTKVNGYELDYKPHHNGDPDTDSDSDLGSSSGEENEVKKGRRKSFITAGLATVATIHAGHSVYQSYEKRQERRKQVAEGEISKDEAKKLKNKGRLQDAASIGSAALGIKGAYSEWNEMREHNAEMSEYKEKIQRHREKRVARREKLEREARRYKESGYTSSMPNLVPRGNGYHDSSPAGYSQGAQTHYYDDNPYSAGPAPPRYNGYPPPPPGPPPPGTYR
jgi:hypothetical protein